MLKDGATRVIIGAGLALSALYALPLPEAVGGAVALAVGVGTAALIVAGVRRNRPERRAPWLLFLAAVVSFLGGILVRPWAVEQSGAAEYAGDVGSLTGYTCMAAALVLMLRQAGRLQRHALIDGLIVCLGAGLVAVELLALPAARIGDRPAAISLLAGLYPVVDVLILLLLLNLGFSTAVALPSFRLIVLTTVSMLVGDTGYAVIGAQGELTGSKLLDVPYLVGYTFFAASAVHPSMREFSAVRHRAVQAWSLPRLTLIGPALLAPGLVLLLNRGGHERTSDVLVAAAVSLMLGGLLIRALSAVRGFASAQEGLVFRATHDALTGLPNRVLLAERVTSMMRHRGGRARPEAWLLFLDLDGFKLVNDHWGHETGDRLLVEVARGLTELAGEGRVVARISGDEFVLAGTGPPDEALAAAAAVQAQLARPVELDEIDLVVTGSIGVATVTDQLDAETLLRDADTAMYRAKAEGRNRIRVFDTAMRQAVLDRMEIEIALRHALARDEFWVAFQPIVDCRSGEVTGAEALVRWAHPGRGSVSPAEFVPVAEETGLIGEIGAFVLEESLRQLAAWRDAGVLPERFRVSVNASTRQLRDHSLREVIAVLLDRYGLPPDRLVVEITESILMTDSEAAVDVLRGLRELGVGLSVDDFGTGFSSLSYLSRFPVTAVKIDRSFVSGLGVDAGDEAIVRAVVALADALDLDVVAEGVEEEAQHRTLRDLGVPLAQGWLWGKAIDGAAFAATHLPSAAARL